MTAKKSLQKFTESEAKISEILSLDQITRSDLESLSESESGQLFKTITDQFNSLEGTDRDKFYKKIEPIVSKSTKNQMWEVNHNRITWAISSLMREYGRMPSKTEIATETKLSRQTIHKHLKEYTNHPQYLEQVEQFRFMTSKVLARVFQFAVNGDVAAAKLYFNVVGALGKSSQGTLIQTQNNYIQINGTVLSQEAVKQLNPEQLNAIEEVLKVALPEPKKAVP